MAPAGHAESSPQAHRVAWLQHPVASSCKLMKAESLTQTTWGGGEEREELSRGGVLQAGAVAVT